MKEKKTYIFGQPDIGSEEARAINRVVASKWIGFGQESIALERELTEYVGASHGVVLNSCTAALHLALILHGVKAGDEVITTSLTFASTSNTILYTGATPVFVDIKVETLNIDESRIEAAITKKTKGIVVVHFGGLPCNMTIINKIARKHGLFVVEDAAHALGAKSDGKMVGNSKNMTCFSFYANKNLTTVDGGFLTVPNKALAERARSLRLHGLSSDAWNRYGNTKKLVFEVVELGYKYNTNDILSAIGRVQLKGFPSRQKRRLSIAHLYDSVLADVPGITLQPKYDSITPVVHGLHLYTVVIDPAYFKLGRDEIVGELRKKGVFAVVHYYPLHLHKLYTGIFGNRKGKLPKTEAAGLNIFSVPLLPQFTKKEGADVAQITRDVLLSSLNKRV